MMTLLKISMFKRTSLIISGQWGAHIVSSTCIAGVLLAAGYRGFWIVEAAAVVVLLRVLYHMTQGPRPILPTSFIRGQMSRLVLLEAKLSVALAAACFLLGWPVSTAAMAAYVGVNLLVQIGRTLLMQKALRVVSRIQRTIDLETDVRQVLIVGCGKRGQRVADGLLDAPELETGVAGFLDFHQRGLWRYRDVPLVGKPGEMERLIAHCRVDAIVIAVEPQDLGRVHEVFAVGEKMGVPVCFSPDIYDSSIARVRMEDLNGRPMLVYCSAPDCRFRLAVKGLVDRLGALCGLILTAPVFLLAAIAIKVESRGPVLFKQVRSGINGRRFNLYKFRTMCRDAEMMKAELEKQNEMSGPVFKIRNDPRVTRVGRLLRKTSLDELPQFLNVLKGDMSLVGPRPPLPDEVARYEPWQHRRLSVAPGVTCTWQVSGRNDIDFEDWMKLDLEYIDNWSLLEDTKIIARTIPAVIKGSGAS